MSRREVSVPLLSPGHTEPAGESTTICRSPGHSARRLRAGFFYNTIALHDCTDPAQIESVDSMPFLPNTISAFAALLLIVSVIIRVFPCVLSDSQGAKPGTRSVSKISTGSRHSDNNCKCCVGLSYSLYHPLILLHFWVPPNRCGRFVAFDLSTFDQRTKSPLSGL